MEEKESLISLLDRINTFKGKVVTQVEFMRILSSSIADKYADSIKGMEEELQAIEGTYPTDEDKDLLCKEVTIPYYHAVLGSLDARIKKARERFKDSRRLYELCMQDDALKMKDVEDVVDAYHAAVEGFFIQQEKAQEIRLHAIYTDKVSKYKRLCDSITSFLDNCASRIFKTEIYTDANIDVKEKMPHQFLFEINLGYENFMLNLVRTISHEGSFGHNTHETLSEGINLSHRFTHTHEGLAILGESIGVEEYFNFSPEEMEIIQAVSRNKRVMYDAFHAAFEKLAYYDRLPASDMIKELQSRIITAEALRQNLGNIEERRDISFSFSATPYYAGFKLVDRIYTQAISELKALLTDEESFKNGRNELLFTMYRGRKPTSVMAIEVERFLKKTRAYKPDGHAIEGIIEEQRTLDNLRP